MSRRFSRALPIAALVLAASVAGSAAAGSTLTVAKSKHADAKQDKKLFERSSNIKRINFNPPSCATSTSSGCQGDVLKLDGFTLHATCTMTSGFPEVDLDVEAAPSSSSINTEGVGFSHTQAATPFAYGHGGAGPVLHVSGAVNEDYNGTFLLHSPAHTVTGTYHMYGNPNGSTPSNAYCEVFGTALGT